MADHHDVKISVAMERITLTFVPLVHVSLNGTPFPIRAKEERFDIDPNKSALFFEELNALLRSCAMPTDKGGEVKTQETT